MSQAVSPPLPLDDDVGAFFLARMDSETGKTPAGQPQPQLAEQQQQQEPPAQEQSRRNSLAPPLPERNARRSSRFLEALVMAATPTATSADSQAAKVDKETRSQALPTPHDVYLSSEEDASSAGDLSDLSDCDSYDGEMLEYDLSPGQPATATATATAVASNSSSATALSSATPPRRHSHDTARLVSVVFSGKPSLVDLGLEREVRRQSGLLAPASMPELSSSTSCSSNPISTRPSSTSSDSASSTHSSSSRTNSTNNTDHSNLNCHTSAMPAMPMASFRDRRSALRMSSTADHDCYHKNAPKAPSPSLSPAPVQSPAESHHSLPAFLHIDPYARRNSISLDKMLASGHVPSPLQPSHLQPSHLQPQPQPQPQSQSHLHSFHSHSSHGPPALLRKQQKPDLHQEPPMRHSTPFGLPLRSATTASLASRTPTPTSGLFRGVTRTLTLSRRRSRQLLSQDFSQNTLTPSNTAPQLAPLPLPTTAPLSAPMSAPLSAPLTAPLSAPMAPPPAPQSPVTYNDIVLSARRKSLGMSAALGGNPMPMSPSRPDTPATPVTGKRSSSTNLFSNLAARRRSLRIAH